jgi:hypothetical protein
LLDAAEGLGTAGCILLADDNADLRKYISRLLSDLGYQVEVAADGEAALAAGRTCRYCSSPAIRKRMALHRICSGLLSRFAVKTLQRVWPKSGDQNLARCPTANEGPFRRRTLGSLGGGHCNREFDQ